MGLTSQTVQASALSATSNVLAQALSAYRSDQTFQLNPAPILKFVLYTALSTAPNCLWQTYLEDTFPTSPPAPTKPKSEKPPLAPTISYKNILIKLVLDQTISAALNTIIFLAFMGYVNASGGDGVAAAVDEVRAKFAPLMLDAYKLWPAFAVVSFVWIPVERRVLAGSVVGVAWGIYLSLLAEA